ncbi:hypothetical protein ACFC09_31550 [Streptomyces sp. NPDC056161]|uniref:hypothetical protein n=1 Tax=Streptomyces sp. NPDC056161 TaxID=3345732 RepID=UPI0035E08C31
MKAASAWLAGVPSLDIPDLREVQRISHALLNRLATDQGLLTRLVGEVRHDPERLAESRVTLLLNRLSLYQAPDRGFEIRLNMNPRPDNQRVPHDHCYAFATRILTGGYVHVVRRRTNGRDGPFTGSDLRPGIVTIERAGSVHAGSHDGAPGSDGTGHRHPVRARPAPQEALPCGRRTDAAHGDLACPRRAT